MFIFDEIMNPANVNDFVTGLPVKPNVMDALFPARKQQSLEVEWLRGSKGLPVVASVHAWDTKTQIANRPGIGRQMEELFFVKNQIPVYEKDIMKLEQTASKPYAEQLINYFFNDVETMVRSVDSRSKALAAEALTTGKLNIDENGAQFVVDYGMPDNHKEVLTPTTDTWDVETINPIEDIEKWVATIEADTGVTPTRALTSRKVLALLRKNELIRSMIYGKDSSKLITNNDINELMMQNGLPQIVAFDEKYRILNEDGTYAVKSYIPENLFVAFPDGKLGEQLFGPTPEERQLLGNPGFNVTQVGNITAQIYKTEDPVQKWTKATATMLPAFTAVDSVFIGQVLA